MDNQYLLNIIYLIASVTFVVGLQMLGGPSTARRGNLIAAFGMTLAVVATIVWSRRSGRCPRRAWRPRCARWPAHRSF